MYNENEKYTHPDIFRLDPDLDWIELLGRASGKYRIWMMQSARRSQANASEFFADINKESQPSTEPWHKAQEKKK